MGKKFTSCYPQHSHNSHDGGVDWHKVGLELLKDNAEYGEKDDDHIQLVPPENTDQKVQWLQELSVKFNLS